jgi:uncharacterized protein
MADPVEPAAEREILPFHTFLWKIASRCNLDCTYCYVYHQPDQSWRRQPKLMPEKVARQAAFRIREHFAAHDKNDGVIVFHGGEPLLGGVGHLRTLVGIIGEMFDGTDVKLQIGMQSNGLLLSAEICDFMLERGMNVGVSLDGPPEVNDIFRIDRHSRPSTARLEKRLRLLLSARYRRLFAGFLCVINHEVDPIEVIDYLLDYEPPNIDFLLPLDNWSRLPRGKTEDHMATPYGDWLIRSFDHWWALGKPTRVRIFDSILEIINGNQSLVESLGLDPADLVVVETNGEIQGVDSLKASFDGAPELGFSVFQNDFDTVAHHQAVQRRQMGVLELCDTCRSCPVVEICGGGYLPHRYSTENGFDNPSVYCADLEKLIRHIHTTLFDAIRRSNLNLNLIKRSPDVQTRQVAAR